MNIYWRSFSFILVPKLRENSIDSTILKFQLHIYLFNFKANFYLNRNIYMEYIYKSEYQDALTIYLMNSLSLYPYHIY